MNSLKEKVIIVTGASSGIGAACCQQLKETGASVIGMDINPPSSGDVDQFIAYDQGSPEDIDRAVAEIPGRANGLLNVAGVAPSKRFSPVDVLRINFFGVRYLTEALVPKLVDGAAIVNMTSGTGASWLSNVDNIKAFLDIADASMIAKFVEDNGIGNDGLGNDAAYPFSKQLLSVWTMKASTLWREKNIRINAVAPAAVETPIVGDFLSSFGTEAAARMASFGSATPELIASASLFLLTNDAAWINGAVLPVDGGAIAAGTMAKLGI